MQAVYEHPLMNADAQHAAIKAARRRITLVGYKDWRYDVLQRVALFHQVVVHTRDSIVAVVESLPPGPLCVGHLSEDLD